MPIMHAFRVFCLFLFSDVCMPSKTFSYLGQLVWEVDYKIYTEFGFEMYSCIPPPLVRFYFKDKL